MTIRPRRTARFVIAIAATLALLGAWVVTAVGAQAATDYTQGVTPVDATQAKFWFKPATPAALVDVHYLVNGTGQQNFRMTNNGGTWEKTVGSLSPGVHLEYWFTYEKGGPLYDTGHFTYTHAGTGGGGGGGGGTGTFPLILQNNTRGTWSNSQIYVFMIGMVTPGEWSYLRPDGTMAHINHLEASAPGHLTKNGVNYANMSFTLAQAGTVTFPAHVEGGRIYISIGSPLYIPISPDDRGWGGPDLMNPTDPNSDVYYDWYEVAYGSGTINFGGNTTQVDQFSFPMTARVRQNAIGYDQTVGITATRDQVMSQYTASVGAPFRPLRNQYRIVAPRSSPAFHAGGAQGTYLQAYIDQVWNYYTTHQFTLSRLGQTFSGRVNGGVLTGTRNDGSPFSLSKPTSSDVFECSHALAPPPPASDTSRQVGAEFCAAFNRGVALNTANWYNPAAYYTATPRNDYAGFFHSIGIDHRAYGFAYDDINDQSSVKILPNANPLTSLTLGVGW